MIVVVYTILLVICPSALCVFGFFAGRCARRIPIVDDNLPWTIHRGQGCPPAEGNCITCRRMLDDTRWPGPSD
jgi:hypothetical protein